LKLKLLLVLFSTTTISLYAQQSAEAIFDAKCQMCHSKTKPTDMKNVIAPAIMGVMKHVKMVYPNKQEAVEFMVDYVQNPSKKKAVCMSQKIDRFGLMPSQKENISLNDLRVVSEWMFDNFPSAEFRGKGMQQGMKNRPTFSMFDINGDGKITQEEFDAFQKSHMKERMGIK